MAARANRWKLGLFVVTGLAALVGTTAWLGAAHFQRDTFPVVTYFDESVQGIDLGSPVKFRGVQVGNVARVAVAPDLRRVEVTLEIERGALRRLGFDPEVDRRPPPNAATDHIGMVGLRAQLVPAGITGLKFIGVDLFDPVKYPPPTLGFPTPWNYLPAVPSTLKGVEDAVWFVLDELPGLSVRVNQLLDKVTALADELDGALEDANVRELSASARSLMQEVERSIEGIDAPGVVRRIEATLGGVDRALAEAEALLARVDDPEGPIAEVLDRLAQLATRAEAALASAEGAVKDADVGRTADDLRAAAAALTALLLRADALTTGLDRDLAAARETLEAVRRLADRLERDPGALLRGRGPDATPGDR